MDDTPSGKTLIPTPLTLIQTFCEAVDAEASSRFGGLDPIVRISKAQNYVHMTLNMGDQEASSLEALKDTLLVCFMLAATETGRTNLLLTLSPAEKITEDQFLALVGHLDPRPNRENDPADLACMNFIANKDPKTVLFHGVNPEQIRSQAAFIMEAIENGLNSPS